MPVIAEGPFHTLIGWRGGGAKWLAFKLDIIRRHPNQHGLFFTETQPFSVWDPPFSYQVEPDDTGACDAQGLPFFSLKKFEWKWVDPARPASSPQLWVNDAWQSILEVSSHDGLPELPILHQFACGEWSATMRNQGNNQLASYPKAYWAEPVGDPYPAESDRPHVPGHVDRHFVAVSSIAIRTLSDPMTGAEYPEWDTPVGELTVDLAAIRVTTNRAWRPVAAARIPDRREAGQPVVGDPSDGVYPDDFLTTTPGEMWVLCERAETASA